MSPSSSGLAGAASAGGRGAIAGGSGAITLAAADEAQGRARPR
jgi:hypothetical protein